MPLELTPRQQLIFTSLVDAYRKRGKPIGSEEIAEARHSIGVSPATIRWELLALQQKGLLAQPHRSAGRIPTPKGYRFFVDYLMEPATLSETEEHTLKELVGCFEEMREAIIESSLHELSRLTHAATFLWSEDHIHSAGSGELARHDALRANGTLANLLELLDELEGGEERTALFPEMHELIEIFIGEEHPFLRKARGKISLIAGKWRQDSLEGRSRGVLGLLGPVHMDYAHNRAVVEYLIHSLPQ